MTLLRRCCFLVALVCGTSMATAQTVDSLPSWRESEARREIVAFVEAVSRPGSRDFVPVSERIAVFDNDGTLWSEQPLYFQLLFALDRVRTLAPHHPEWKETEPFASLLRGDVQKALAGGDRAVLEIVAATHAGMTSEEFSQIVNDWMATSKHPKTGRPYSEMVFQPMLELLDFLRKSGFKTFIVSGGGADFMRPWTERVYGIPPEQVVGSTIKTRFALREDKPVLLRLPELNFLDDKEGKPVGIHQQIGRRPIFAAGNSDGDLQMLQWTTAGQGRRLGLLIRHTDAQREWAYDRNSPVGRLDLALDAAAKERWLILDMQRDWRRVYPWNELQK